MRGYRTLTSNKVDKSGPYEQLAADILINAIEDWESYCLLTDDYEKRKWRGYRQKDMYDVAHLAGYNSPRDEMWAFFFLSPWFTFLCQSLGIAPKLITDRVLEIEKEKKRERRISGRKSLRV